jgi:hypothetical protein
MGATAQQTEAIKLISEWCKWFSALEVAAIAAIGSAFLKDARLSHAVAALLSIAIVLFVGSITITAFALTSLPEAVQDIDPNDSVWDRRVQFLGTWTAPLWRTVNWQLTAFVSGTGSFAAAIIVQMWR